jgi:molecular chaperone DnaK (HSP70)
MSDLLNDLYSVGIDLGTTNCALSTAVCAAEGRTEITDLAIAQVTHPGTVQARPTLPSFLYVAGPHDLPVGSLDLPWKPDATEVIGAFAREQGAKVPHRLVSSAKSWLCCEGIDRRSSFLPFKSPDEVEKRSPVDVAAAYLEHLRNAYNEAHPGAPLQEQPVVLTVPASFDVVARELTVEAARRAGLEHLTLLEEPQAALYAWLAEAGDDWRKHIGVDDRILVCDIGGGTSDFSLIAVGEHEGNLRLERQAVGDHLLLGGDNMDLALAVAVQSRLKSRGTKLDSWQFQVLTHACRDAKEKILSTPEVDTVPLVIPGRGSGLIGGTIREELLRTDVESILLGGFFPQCEHTDFATRQRRLGLAELGLPFETDAAITRHLAGFLGQRGASADGAPLAAPTAVLFNGGVLKSPLVRERIVAVLNSWLEAMGRPPLRVLHNDSLELAVARGAAAYGIVRRGKGIRIKGGIARSYFIGVEVPRPAIPGLAPPVNAVCVAANGMEEGSSVDIPSQQFVLRVGQTAEFRFMAAARRDTEQPGDVVEDWEPDDGSEIDEIANLTLDLADAGQPGETVAVSLRTHLTELGTLELWCDERGGQRHWKLELQVRETTS